MAHSPWLMAQAHGPWPRGYGPWLMGLAQSPWPMGLAQPNGLAKAVLAIGVGRLGRNVMVRVLSVT